MLEVRLSEALQAFAILQSINRHFLEPSGDALRGSIAQRAGFWHPVTLGLQTTVLTSMMAILDKSRDDCATIYYVLDRLSPAQSAAVPSDFERSLDTIRDRYKTYRHKIFAHNDLKRLAFAEAFDQAGFTWETVSNDLSALDYAAKVLGHVLDGKVPPSPSNAKHMLYSFNLAEAHSVAHCQAFVQEIGSPKDLPENNIEAFFSRK